MTYLDEVDVAIIGAGPAGLTAAAALAASGVGEVVVLEREPEAGGIPRHSDHLGYGIRDHRRFISGPRYAKRLVADAEGAGVRIERRTMVTGWADDTTLEVTSARGRGLVRARAIVLATGARERPRPARRIPGDRPDGVLTTGQLQNLVHLHHQPAGRRAVVVGAELVSWSAVLTLREAGCKTVFMTTEHPRSDSYLAFRLAGRFALRVPVRAETRVVGIRGRERVAAVELEHSPSGRREIVECDTVVFTGDWIPDHELARATGLVIDPSTLGPRVGADLATSRPGVFAAGNVVHPVDTADVAALDGRHVAETVAAYLAGSEAILNDIDVTASSDFNWVSPQRLASTGHEPPRGKLLFWPRRSVRLPVVVATQAGRTLATHRSLWPAEPGRVFRVPASLLDEADPSAGPVEVSLRD